MTNNDFDTIMHTPDDCKGDTMTAKLNRAKLFNSLASQSELIRLEALCHIADSLDLIAAEHGNKNDAKTRSHPTTHHQAIQQHTTKPTGKPSGRPKTPIRKAQPYRNSTSRADWPN